MMNHLTSFSTIIPPAYTNKRRQIYHSNFNKCFEQNFLWEILQFHVYCHWLSDCSYFLIHSVFFIIIFNILSFTTRSHSLNICVYLCTSFSFECTIIIMHTLIHFCNSIVLLIRQLFLHSFIYTCIRYQLLWLESLRLGKKITSKQSKITQNTLKALLW